MALPAKQRAAEPVNWWDWVPIDRAAKALGVHRDSLARTCRDKLAPQGLAMNCRGPEGGNPRWWIHRNHDDRLGRGEYLDAETPPDLDGFTASQIAIANARRRCVMLYREAKGAKVEPLAKWIGGFLSHVSETIVSDMCGRGYSMKLSRRSLERWDQLYQGPADFDKLIDRRGGDMRSQGDGEAWRFFKSIYLHGNRVKAKVAWRMTREQARREGWNWCSYGSCLRQIDQRIPPAVQAYTRDPRAYKNSVEPVGEMDSETFAANQTWIGDHAELDIFVRVRSAKGWRIVRPWITAWMDWRTRKIVGYVVTLAPSSATIGQALKRGIEDPDNLGPPALVWIDNGKDYKARALGGLTKQQRLTLRRGYMDEPFVGGIFGLLGIEPHFAIPYNGRGKGRLETWFGHWLHEHFDKTFTSSYCGNNSANRPEHVTAAIKDHANVATLAEVEGALAKFITGYNCGREHDKGDLIDGVMKLSPSEALAAWGTKRVLNKPDVLKYLLLHRTEPVAVGKRGVRVQVKGITLGWGSGEPALIPYMKAPGRKAQKVVIGYDPHDMDHAWVFDVQGRFICQAKLNHTGGAYGTAKSIEHAKTVNRRKAKLNQALKLVRDEQLPLRIYSNEELIAQEAAQEARANRTEPAGYQVVQTPLDGQLKSMVRPELRRAAGGEVSTDDPFDDEILEPFKPTRSLQEVMRDIRAREDSSDDVYDTFGSSWYDDDEPINLAGMDDEADHPDSAAGDMDDDGGADLLDDLP